MEKKHTNRFSIVFNPITEQQEFAIEKLNSLPPRSLALYLGQVIYAYEHRIDRHKSQGSIKKYSDTAMPIPNNQEKRKRGRPRKKTQSEVSVQVSENRIDDTPDQPVSLSHISQKNCLSEQPATTNDNSPDSSTQEIAPPQIPFTADATMLSSMLNFMEGGQC